MTSSSLQIEAGLALEEFVQKLERLTQKHVEACHAEQSARALALDERERQISEREHDLEEKIKLLKQVELSGLEKLADTDEAAVQKSEEKASMQKAQAEKELATLKSSQPERAKAALMVPSPTRARGSLPLPTQPTNTTPCTAPQTGPSQPFSSPSPQKTPSGVPPVPPCSPPVASPIGMVSVQRTTASPQPEEGNVKRKVSAFVERKEKLLLALNSGGFQANSGADDSIMNISVVSTPGRNSNTGGAAKSARRSLADLLQEDEARLAKLRSSQ